MAPNNLKSLSRTELLEMLLVQTKEVERLQGLLDEANAKLASRELKVSQAGDLASAAMQVNGVFDAARGAAEQYLENIRSVSDRQMAESQARAASIVEQAERRCAELERATATRCVRMMQTFKAESEACWKEVATRMSQSFEHDAALREILQISLGGSSDPAAPPAAASAPDPRPDAPFPTGL